MLDLFTSFGRWMIYLCIYSFAAVALSYIYCILYMLLFALYFNVKHVHFTSNKMCYINKIPWSCFYICGKIHKVVQTTTSNFTGFFDLWTSQSDFYQTRHQNMFLKKPYYIIIPNPYRVNKLKRHL